MKDKKNKLLIIIIIFILILMSGCGNDVSVALIPENDQGQVPVLSQTLVESIAQGNIEGATMLYKFGASELDTTMHPLTLSQVYKTPTTPQTLEFVSDSASDTYLGSGARQITITYINSSWEENIMIINTSGLTPVILPNQVLRIYRWYVSSSGTYATDVLGSHVGNLIIRESGAGALWTTILNTPFPGGQSQIGATTIPKGKSAWLLSKDLFTDSSKSTDVYMYQRCNADDIIAPYNGTMRLIQREVGVTGGQSIIFKAGKGPYIGPCDIGFMGKVSVGTSEASIEFEMVILDTE